MTIRARASRRPTRIRRWAPLEAYESRTLLSAAPVVTGPGSPFSPGPVLTTTTPTFRWQPVVSAGMTHLQLNLFDLTRSKFNSYYALPTATSFTLPAGVLVRGDAYVWNLRTVAGTVSGPPSTYLFFKAPAALALPAPVILSPGSVTSPGPTLTTSTPTFRWNPVAPVPGMTHYQLNLFDVTRSKFTSYLASPTATSFTLPAGVLTAGDSYVWNLRIVVGTRTGPPSAYFYFKAPAPASLPAPVILGPGSATTPLPVVATETPTFQWLPVTGVPGMTGYQLNLYDQTLAHFSSYVIPANATSFTLPAGVLVSGDTFIWNLRIVVGATTGPPESAYFRFVALFS